VASSETSYRDPDPPTFRGILIAGPPASGKRTLTFALTSMRRSYAPFRALSAALHPTIAAERSTERHLDELKAWAQVFHEFTEDGMRYVFDHGRLNKLREHGRIPVATVCDTAGMLAFEREADDWLPILLWCPREVAEQREPALAQPARRRRWDRSLHRLTRHLARFALVIRSDRWDAIGTAQLVHIAAQSGGPPD
jgi:guanylate kinase